MRLILLLCLMLFPIAAQALEITGLHSQVQNGGEHVTITLSGRTDYKVFLVQNLPPRLVVDLPVVRWNNKTGLPDDYSGALIQKIRFGRPNSGTSRLVFDLSASVSLGNVRLLYSRTTLSYLLEFDLTGGRAVQPTPIAPAVKKKTSSIFEFPKSATKPVIIIDAGHGGQDPGTSGIAGTEEKNVTLRYALALKEALLKTGRYSVALTREDDRYLFLRDRVKRARLAHGDLFISLHADSAPTRSARGLSVYTISETASDKETEALAAKENKADVIGGMDLSDTSQDVANILIELAERETRAKSARFADLAIKDLGQEVSLLSNTHRFAGFAVLKAPDIPSVLIEIGFLTSPREEKLLKSGGYETKVVHALVKAIDSYFGKHKK